MRGFLEDWPGPTCVEADLTEAEIEEYLRRRAARVREIAQERLAARIATLADPPSSDAGDRDLRPRLRARFVQLHERHANGLASADDERRLLLTSFILHRLRPQPLIRVPMYIQEQWEPASEVCECDDPFAPLDLSPREAEGPVDVIDDCDGPASSPEAA